MLTCANVYVTVSALRDMTMASVIEYHWRFFCAQPHIAGTHYNHQTLGGEHHEVKRHRTYSTGYQR